uniref:Uncharacterized protein n=1 Tax=Pelusios castaneus TaxID=367368 RepID=A0A8C8RHZ9_9SAUR
MAAGGQLRGTERRGRGRARSVWPGPAPVRPASVKRIHGGCRALLESRAKPEPGRPVHKAPEYTPTQKAKNPMKIMAVAWAIGLPSGIILFLLTKRQVDKNRLKQMKSRQRMWESNSGEYESKRYGKTSLRPLDMTDTKP